MVDIPVPHPIIISSSASWFELFTGVEWTSVVDFELKGGTGILGLLKSEGQGVPKKDGMYCETGGGARKLPVLDISDDGVSAATWPPLILYPIIAACIISCIDRPAVGFEVTTGGMAVTAGSVGRTVSVTGTSGLISIGSTSSDSLTNLPLGFTTIP